ncbi:hypothetical protein [Paracoccus fistulariae]|uniref:ApeA N-terminal domain-containing protein n=1 Tax=Paracoccus fistulariae TaxID=658446 RepID=A0ABY7SNY0_9RHOB|nr:hypothetical protein [Paracoccus fistulariae]MDB6182534.1 hypothetical protein [Paracoccus fistulariae]WCR07746.1 hypothetical protein JHX87_02610 [Paracoccus fistulariae]
MIFEPKQWEKPSPREMLDFMDRKKKPGKATGGILVFRKQLSPLSVYKYLVARFGQPYGFQTMAKKPPDSDNLFHWDYLLKAGDAWIHIQGGNRDVQVAIFGLHMSPKKWVKFANALKGDFVRCGREMAVAGATFEKWSIISNRFALIADTCAGFHEVLIDEQDAPDFAPGKRRSEAGIKRYHKHIKKIRNRANRVFSASLSLDLITPVLAESFINFIIFSCRKDELKRNPRQYDHYIRQPIDTRVFDLHLKCNYFRAGVDPNRDEYRAFKRVMDRRNHNLHGNIDPAEDAIETVFFDKSTPLYERGADPILELFRNKEAVFDVAGVLTRYHDVHTFFYYVLNLLEEKPRAEMKLMMEESTFGYDVSRERAGRLFPSHGAMMLVPLNYDDELNIDWR